MSDSQGEATTSSGTSTGCNTSGTADISEPGTSSQHSKMGVENKLSSSSREMRNMAEKMRRDKLNNYVAEIAGIVPLGSGANKRIDKTSVLRLAANYIRMHNILKEDDDSSNRVPESLSRELTSTLAEAVGGFLLVVTSSGKVVYITEAVDQFFGHTQVDLLGHSIYNVIHPDDHDIFQQQLVPKDNSRRSFFCRMMEKALSRNDPGRYEIIHVVGQLRPLPQIQTPLPSCSVTSPAAAPSPGEMNTSSDHDDDDSSDNDGDIQPLKVANRIGTHMLVSFVRVVKDRPITELSLVESTQEEYITRHGMDGKILYTDHRISFVTGLMPSEVVGTSAFTYMHQDDMVWSIVAQKLMFTSSQGQGIVSYRLKCRDGAHVTLRSRGFLEVNKQTGQVESFVCINTVLSVKEAALEIKNQRRKLLPIIAGHESEDHLSSISSSLPPELMMVLKQIMNPEMMQKMIESVENGDMLESESSEATKTLLVDTSEASLTPMPATSSDWSKDPDHNGGCIDHPFQTKPKRLCSEVATYESLAEPSVSGESVDKDQWQRITKKRSNIDYNSSVTSKKLHFDTDMPCPELLHPNYSANTYNQQHQFSPRTASPQPCLSPTTSLVPENINNYPSGSAICHQYSSSINTSDSHSHSVNSNVIHPKISQQYQNTGAVSPGSYWQRETQSASPRHCGQFVIAPDKGDRRISQNLPSPTGYNQRIAANIPTSPGYIAPSPGYDQSKGGGSVSPGLCELRLTDSENPQCVRRRRTSGGLTSPGNCNQTKTVSSNNVLQDRCDVMPPHGSRNQGIGSYNQSTSPGLSSPGSSSQNMCEGIPPSVKNYNHDERKPHHPPSQDCDQSGSGNISCHVPPPQCSYQFDILSPKDQSTLMLQNQIFPQYQQPPSSTPHPMNPQYQYPIPSPEQSFALSRQTSSSTSPGHYSDFPPQLQKQHSPHARQVVPSNQETGHHAVPVFTTQSVSFGEAGTSGVPSVPEPTIPEQHSSLEDTLSKETGNMFSNGHFQHYPSHNQHEGKLL